MEKKKFHIHHLHQKRNHEKSHGKSFAFILGAIVLLGGTLLYPKIAAKWEFMEEERRLSDIRKDISRIPEEAFQKNETFTLPEVSVAPPKKDFLEQLADVPPGGLPEEKLLGVPFVCQNPFQNEEGWKFHKESCEEAALLQTYLFLTGETVTPEEADEIIRDMIAWQERPENFGKDMDLYGEDMEIFIEGYYKLEPEQVIRLRNLDKEAIQKVIYLGYPLIVPIQGDLLKNPFYPEPGYHMMTVIGYSAKGVITNDVGTKRGEKYMYDWERFLRANRPVGNDALVILELN